LGLISVSMVVEIIGNTVSRELRAVLVWLVFVFQLHLGFRPKLDYII